VKSEGQVKQKLKQVIYRHRKSHVERGMTRIPENCTHNRAVRLPVHTGNRAVIHVCAYLVSETEPNDVVCDSTMAGEVQARECPYFEGCHSAEDLKDEFTRNLGLDGSPVNIGVIAKEYPDVAALMWALGPDKKMDTKAPAEPGDSGILAFFGESLEEPDVVPERPLVEDSDDR